MKHYSQCGMVRYTVWFHHDCFPLSRELPCDTSVLRRCKNCNVKNNKNSNMHSLFINFFSLNQTYQNVSRTWDPPFINISKCLLTLHRLCHNTGRKHSSFHMFWSFLPRGVLFLLLSFSCGPACVSSVCPCACKFCRILHTWRPGKCGHSACVNEVHFLT